MHELTVEFNKKLYRLKRLSDFYFQVLDERSGDQVVISDLEYVFISPSKHKFCDFCFGRRYWCFSNAESFLLGETPQTLEDKDWEKKSEGGLRIVDSCLEESKSLPNDQWKLYKMDGQELVQVFSLIPYEICSSCSKRQYMDLADEKEGERLAASFQKKVDESEKGDVNKKFNDLYKFLIEDSFGFVSYFNTFEEAGFEDKSLEEGLESNCVTTLLSYSPSNSDPIMCGGQDKDKKISQIKAIMEFVERYAMKNKVFRSSIISNTTKNVANNVADIEPFLKLFDPALVSSDMVKKLNSSLVWAVDLVSNTKALLPLGCVYALGEVPFVKPTSNGFAAHFSVNKAIESATLELVERDAFVRFWLKPERAKVVSLSNKAEETLGKIINTLGGAIGNDSLRAKVLLLGSPLNVPVVWMFITSEDATLPPALLLGSSCDFDLERAVEKAFGELRVAVLNLVAHFQRDPNWLEKGPKKDFSNFDTPEDHMYLYHHPEQIPKIKILKHFLDVPGEIDSWKGPKNLSELKKEFKNKGIQWYVLDATPKIFEEYGVFVPRCFIPEFYPLQFGHPVPFDLKDVSELSIVKELPHCFS